MARDDDDDNLPPIDLGALEGADGLDYREQRAIPGDDRSAELDAMRQELADLRGQLAAAVSLIRYLQEQTPRLATAGTTGGNACVVKVTGNASGGGKFNGRILTGDSTAVATGNLSMPEGMTVPAADNALVLSLYENGLSTHDLGINTYHVGVKCGVSGGKTVVVVQALNVNGC